MTMKLESHTFFPGDRLPAKYTCDAGDASPPLLWLDPPEATRSFALVCSDPDAPDGTFYHWAIYDIPAAMDRLPEHYPPQHDDKGPRQARNDFERHGYNGPCPPRGHGPHRYVFRLYALSVPHLDLPRSAGAREVERAAEATALARAEVMGSYER